MVRTWRASGSICPQQHRQTPLSACIGSKSDQLLLAMPTCVCTDGAYLEGFREYLSTAAQAGERAKPNPGAGAEASGQAHLWRDFGGMKTKQRIALIQEMQKVRRACVCVKNTNSYIVKRQELQH
jgi:hypothetical protein